MKILALFLPLIMAWGESPLRQRNQRVMKLLLQEEKALADRLKYKHGPQWRWRFMKLQMEKYKLVRQGEDEKFLNSPIELRMKKKKKWFFRKSRPLYEKIKQEGLLIIKKWPNFARNDQVYYALAANTLNHNDPIIVKQEMARYLMKALELAPEKSPLVKKVLASLAEHYYNQKQYTLAIRYYNQLLEKDKGRWITKHLFNMGWCYVQTGRTEKALQVMKRSLALSRSEGTTEYIDYSEQIIDSSPLFFSRAEKVKEGVAFFLKEKKDPKDSLLKMANYSKDSGKYQSALYIYSYFLNMAKKEGKRDDMVDALILQLDLFAEFKKRKKHQQTTKLLTREHQEKPLKEEQRVTVVEKVRTSVGPLQDILHKSRKKKGMLKPILSYFNQLKKLDPEKASHYSFYQGETLFSIQDYSASLKRYNQGIELFNKKKNKSKKDRTINKKTFESMFASLEKMSSNKKITLLWGLPIYISYLALYPVNKRSNSIYQRLFNIYFQQKDTVKSEKVLDNYVKYYPKDNKKQQFMLSQLIKRSVDEKNIPMITHWIKKLRNGYLGFDKSYLDKISLIRSDIVFEQALGQKKPSLTIPMYQKIYKNRENHRLIRAKAAYYTGLNLVNLQETSDSLLWFKRTLAVMPDQERNKFQEGILKNIEKMVYIQDFDNAHKLASIVFKNSCSQGPNARSAKKFLLKNDFFNASILYTMMAGEYKTAYHNFRYGKKCAVNIGIQTKNLKYMAQFYLIHRSYAHFDQLFEDYKKQRNLKKFFAQALLSTYWEAVMNESVKDELYAFNHINGTWKNPLTVGSNKDGLGKEITAAIAFYQLRQELAKKNLNHFVFHELPGKFNEEHFNKNLKSYLAELEAFTTKIGRHINTGYPQIVCYGHHILSQRYQAFGEKLMAFRPQGVDKNYVKSFLQAMKELGHQFSSEAKQQRQLGIALLEKEQILSHNSDYFALGEKHIAHIVRHRHPASFYGLTVDRERQKRRRK